MRNGKLKVALAGLGFGGAFVPIWCMHPDVYAVDIIASWDENNAHHWRHTISNAQIVAMGLLWSEGDFGKGICRAVQACLDTEGFELSWKNRG